VKIVDNVPQTIVHHVVLQLTRSHAVAKAGLFQVIGRHAHGFHAAGDHHLGIADLNGLRGQHHGFQRRAADFVDRDAFGLRWHAGFGCGLFGRILSVSAGQHVAHDHFIDADGIDSRSLHGFGDDQSAQFGSAHGAQAAVETSQGCAYRTDNNSFAHNWFSFSDGRLRMVRSIAPAGWCFQGTRPYYEPDGCNASLFLRLYQPVLDGIA